MSGADVIVDRQRRLVAAHDREEAVFRAAAALFEPPVEVLAIPWQGTTLPAYFARVDTSGRPRPTIPRPSSSRRR